MFSKKSFIEFPKERIMELYRGMNEEGVITITYYPEDPLVEEYDMSYSMKWDYEQARALNDKFLNLIRILEKLAFIHDKLIEDESKVELLAPDEREVWNAFLIPFPRYEHEDRLEEFYQRIAGGDDLSEEENEIYEGYFDFCDAEALKRLPYKATAPTAFIQRARRYEFLVQKGAPAYARNYEARCMAEEMVLYYYLERVVNADNELDDILSGKTEM